MLPQKKSLLRRNAWFRQQYLPQPLTSTTAETTAANEECNLTNRRQPLHFDSTIYHHGASQTE
ncbi:hypothetical protein A5320_02745 [Rheinheimera sp. SA_1]|uniref:hypothetical protein n=1 Tax=Rheinheimera sp. SA_1 TaxID=1827365 RepID=UPI000801A940|nr:hypothetical protein [Rheinheimera sp. SA_1]OBP16345.1 hypothetical protein A5320_02745 [Rheinheimera sp. SA_1]